MLIRDNKGSCLVGAELLMYNMKMVWVLFYNTVIFFNIRTILYYVLFYDFFLKPTPDFWYCLHSEFVIFLIAGMKHSDKSNLTYFSL